MGRLGRQRVGRDCVALGNGLAGNDVVDQMVRSFESSRGSLAERLMAALEAGQQAGGDIRGQQSAALLVFRRNGGYGSLDDRHVVISIYDHDQPIAELVRCYALHRLSYFPSDPAKLMPIGPELAIELKQLMAARGFYQGPVDGSLGTVRSSNGSSSSWAARTTTTASTPADGSMPRSSPTCAAGTASRPRRRPWRRGPPELRLVTHG